MAKLDSRHFSKAELDKILNAFYDICDVVDSNDLTNSAGVTDESASMGSLEASEINLVEARNIIFNR